MSVVAAALRRHGMRTLLYADDLLITWSSFEEASQARRIIEETLLAAGIVRAPLKGCFDKPSQTLPDHLGFSISTIDKGTLRGGVLRSAVKRARCFSRFTRIGAWSTQTSFGASRAQPSCDCQQFL